MGEPRIAVIGGGNMARAIIEGCVASGAFEVDRWLVSEPDAARRGIFEAMGVQAVADTPALAAALDPSDALLLAVKPQMLERVAEQARAMPLEDRLVMSILAGATSERIRAALGGGCRLVRIMPNTPAQIGKGASAIAPGAGATEEDTALAERIFGAVGAVWRTSESMMDAFTALAGSGPAYVFALAEAMQCAGEQMGFSSEEADAMVRATLAGSAALLERREMDAATLRRAVTSPGGTTAAAIQVLEDAGFGAMMVRAIEAARERGAELAGEG
ncbi:MAG: pyrroline-5-carboxylate reductase [Planctomycetota bacterium]